MDGVHDLTVGRHVVHEPTGLPVRGVHGAQEAPGLGQEPTDRRGPHFGKGGTPVHAAEVGQVADKVQLVGHDGQAGALH